MENTNERRMFLSVSNTLSHHGSAIKTSLRFYFTPVSVAIIKETKQIIVNACKDMGREESLFINGRNMN